MKKTQDDHSNNQQHSQPFKTRWPAWIALLSVALLYEALPKAFYWGPRGLLMGLVTVLIIPLIITHWRQRMRINRLLYLSINSLITLYMVISVSRLILAVLEGHIGPSHLLLSAVTLWTTNILIFALWYWSLDGGGQWQRDLKKELNATAFLFPQLQIILSSENNPPDSIKKWQPHFVDYLFISFNTSTAFSPTDTPLLARWAKCMSMIQSMISLTTIVMLAARAINILSPNTSYLVS